MLTKIDLCSMALLKLGESPIQSLTDDSAAAKLSRTLFDTIVNSLLSLHPWRFATQQIDLVKNTDNDFLIPSDVLRVLKTDGKMTIILQKEYGAEPALRCPSVRKRR